MRVLVVANPAAGGADEELLRDVAGTLSSLGVVHVLEADDEDSLPQRIEAEGAEAEVIVVAGGDGTLNCTINALSQTLDTKTFGLLPMGTGNDFARTLGLPQEVDAAARMLLEHHVRNVDVGRALGSGVERLFLNACMGGIAVEVDRAIDAGLKERFGPIAFWVGGAKAATKLDRFIVRIDGIEVPECVGVGIGNGRTCGGGFEVWPEAQPDDGLLDICALGAPNVAAAARLLLKVRAGTHEEMDEVRSITAPRVTVEADPVVEFNVDGELIGLRTPVTFELVTQLRFLAPPSSL